MTHQFPLVISKGQVRWIAGMKNARQRGTRSGSRIGRPKRIFERSELVRLREAGISIEKIGGQMHLGVGAVARVLQAHQSPTVTVKRHCPDLCAWCVIAPLGPMHG